jgi:myo-inositol-1(or 4)-monophosphatase
MDELTIAVNITRQAGNIILEGWHKKDLEVHFKGKMNPVTEIDKSVESYITEQLKKNFPEYGILSEESDEKTGMINARWILDPLDGTTNFTKRYPFVAISLALQKKGELVLGVVYNPILDEMFLAEKGHGAFCNGKPISVNKTSELELAVLGSGFPYDAWENNDNNTAQWSRLIKQCISLRCDGSAALDLCRVACGQFDGYWEKGLSPWDMAAGIVIVREAGGIVTDYMGGDDIFSCAEIIASNTALHREIMKSVTE